MASRGAKKTPAGGGDGEGPQGGNVIAMGAALDTPKLAPKLAKGGDQAPFGGRDEDDDLDRPLLPASCPVRALGMTGQTYWYLDVQGQLIGLAPRDHGKNNILGLFTPRVNLPEKYWPQWSKPEFEGRGNNRQMTKQSEIIGFDQALAAKALIASCGEAGIFDAHNRVRGRGAHPGAGGTLVIHVGDQVMVSVPRITGMTAKPAVWHQPGEIDGYVYTAGAPAPRPHPDPVDTAIGEQLLALLSTWRWRRPELDAMLALGWAGQGFVCGALDWRSHLFVTGGAGTGKSSLNGKGGVFDLLFGGGALRTGNASEAAVRQLLMAQTIPVIFDEFEPNEFNASKMASVIELARVSSSGSDFHRGSADHKAQQFTLRSAFQFSAILIPEMQPQDRSRFAILELQPFAEGAAPLDLARWKLPELGRRLARRMVDGWPRFAATYAAYRAALARVGNTPRACDQFGTLLACADLLLYDEVPHAELVDEWAAHCSPERLSEISDSAAEHDACITRLTTTAVQARGGDEREPLSVWIERGWRDNVADASLRARERLQHHGLKLVTVRDLGNGKMGATEKSGGVPVAYPTHLAVANGHIGLDAIYNGSKWRGGGWGQTLARVPDAVRGVKTKFAGRGLWAVCVPIGAVIDISKDGEGDA